MTGRNDGKRSLLINVIVFKPQATTPVGISFKVHKKSLFIAAIQEGSLLSAFSSQIRPGDELVSINRNRCRNKSRTVDWAETLLRGAARMVTIEVKATETNPVADEISVLIGERPPRVVLDGVTFRSRRRGGIKIFSLNPNAVLGASSLYPDCSLVTINGKEFADGDSDEVKSMLMYMPHDESVHIVVKPREGQEFSAGKCFLDICCCLVGC